MATITGLIDGELAAEHLNDAPSIRLEMEQLRADIHNVSGTYPDYEQTRTWEREWVKRLDRLLSLLPKD